MSPRDRSPVRTPSLRQPSGKDNCFLGPYNLTLLQLEQTTGSSGQRRPPPPINLEEANRKEVLITPSLRHCSNKYKLKREGEKDKEKYDVFFVFFMMKSSNVKRDEFSVLA